MGRIIIFTGKGGVGKTSLAAAHATLSAKNGKRTLIMSTDMAHSLGDVFDQGLGKSNTHITNNLEALEVDPNYLMDHEYKDMKNALSNMMETSGMPFGAIEQLSLFPGMDELFALLKILDVYESDRYDNIIVDCAPTGETLTLLKFPELLSWYMEKFFPVGKLAMRVLSPISKVVFKVALPDRAAMTDIEKLFVKLLSLQALLKDRAVTSIRLVTMPEKMVVEETKRNYMYMNLYNFHVDAVFINRILPKDIENSFFNEWLVLQNQYIEELEHLFTQVPIYKVPWFDGDLSGLSGLVQIEKSTLKGWEVFDVTQVEKGEAYEKIEGGYLLKLFLPTLRSSDLDLHESSSDIIVKVGNFKRNIPKPNALRHHHITGAKLLDQTLTITLKLEEGATT